MFLKRATAFAAATATALTLSTAAPAHAGDDDDLARFLFGALATGLLAHAINESNRSDHHRPTVTHRPHHHHVAPHKPHRPKSVTVTPRYSGKSVPANCQRRLKTQHGPRIFLGRPCLESRGYNVSSLPSTCARTLDFGNRKTQAWGVSCLAARGYRLR